MTESLRAIKNRRTIRRGRLTTLRRQIDEHAEKDPREHDITILNNFFRSMKKEVKSHTELQTEYENILAAEEGDQAMENFSAEVTSGEEYQRQYEQYLYDLEAIILDHNLFKDAERLLRAHQAWMDLADIHAKTFIAEGKGFIQDITDYLKKSESRSSTEVLKHERDRLNNAVVETYKLFHTIHDTPSTTVVEARREPVEHRTKFDIELPHFNGNPVEWAQFFSLFSTTIENRGKHLSKEEKCCLLLKSLKDPKARELAQLNTPGEDGYNTAISALIQRYGQATVVLPHHIAKIKTPQQFTFSGDSLLSLGNQFCSTYKALKVLDVDLSTFLAAYAASQFDPKLTEEWVKHTTISKSLPTMEDLDNYVQKLVCRLPSSPSQTKSNSNSTINLARSPSQPKTKQNSSCILCPESVHSLTKCPLFKDYTPEKRGRLVKERKWCTNCLHHSHQNQHCTSTFTCRHCNGRHHTLLHRGDSSNSSTTTQPVATVSGTFINTVQSARQTPTTGKTTTREALAPPTHAFLNTALVKVSNGSRHRTARLALDSGSSTSLISESLASHLRLRRYPHRLRLKGAYSGGASKNYVQATLQSLHDHQNITLKLSVVSKLPFASPPSRTEDISSDVNVKDLQLADSQFGGSLDILLGNLDVCKCSQGRFQYYPQPDIAVSPTIFGWTVSGPLDSGQSSKFLSIQTTKDDLQHSLERLWTLEQVPESSNLTSAEQSALTQFQEQHHVQSDGRYSVSLPRIDNPPALGQSRSVALSRFYSNERSLLKREKLTEFNESLQEYETMDHAELVPSAELHNTKAYYLPVHGVFKETSTTTKVRPVFDASSKSSNGIALNDLLLAGPNLYPLLSDILIQFRSHRIGFSADISKMFREIQLNNSEYDLHRFLMRTPDNSIKDFRMKRLTFGVKASPFLATKVIQDLAERFSHSHPTASKAILQSFYVDDFLSGALSVEDATHIREEICDLLQQAGMTLRKWRSSCPEFSSTIPDSLLESSPLNLAEAPKALGIHWDVQKDSLNIATPSITGTEKTTKRIVASESARVYDILGLFAPFTIISKIILQRLWQEGNDWDSEAPETLSVMWQEWCSQLPLIHNHHIDRRYDRHKSTVIHRSLHGFSDASESAYGAVVYLRQLHEDGQTTLAIVIAKARVAPLKSITIPRAELVAAHLVAKLLVYSAKQLNISLIHLNAWTDSSIVLAWLRKAPSSLQVFVANRTASIQSLLPDVPWRHVSTKDNPADLLSRGVSASKLLEDSLWWHGPQWLALPPDQWRIGAPTLSRSLPEQKAVTLTVIASANSTFTLWDRFSSFTTLARVLAWIRRFIKNTRQPQEVRNLQSQLESIEIFSARNKLFQVSQQQTYPTVIKITRQSKQLPSNHPLAAYNVDVNDDGLILVSGRVRQLGHKLPKKVVVLSLKSDLTKLFIATEHRTHLHPGVSALMAILTENYFISGLKSQLKFISRSCVICQKAYNHNLQPPMGMLPSTRTTPSPPFTITGIDFAGPFTIRKGHTRKPVLIKAYLCLFVCFSTKAVHLELCSDLSTSEFIAALQRFCARRGTPSDIHSDNGTNFVGAATDLKEIQHLLNTSKKELSHLSTTASINWHFIPPRAPNFGGLWEAGIRQAKLLMKKLVAPHPLKYEELYTILTEIEAILNSRPITPLDSTEIDGDLVLTPGHFLIGRPLKAPARPPASQAQLTSLRRWNLVHRLQQDFWITWQSWYLQTLEGRKKWSHNSHSPQVGDIVLVKDSTLTTHLSWPLAKITTLYNGDDGIPRAADLLCHGKTYKRAISRLIPLVQPHN